MQPEEEEEEELQMQPEEEEEEEELQMQPEEEEEEEELQMQPEEEEEELLQPKSEAGDAQVRSNPTKGLGAGRSLSSDQRAFFEPRFGRDFGAVRIHDDAAAAACAKSLTARAFAYGNHIVFSQGRFAPDTLAGRTLLAHELTHTVQQGRAPVLQRTPDEDIEAMTRRFVGKAVESLERGAEYAENADLPMDQTEFGRMIDAWLRTVVRNEKMIKDRLAGDATLIGALRAAYTTAIRKLVTRMAKVGGQTETELYRINSGRIPMWAWPTAHHLVSGFSTPIPEGKTVDSATGRVDYTVNGVSIRILPDTTNSKLKQDSAKTTGHLTYSAPNATPHTKAGVKRIKRVHAFSQPVLTIQTAYGPGATAPGTSKYGRGTTDEDKAGAKELPRSKTLGFHEGAHALAMLEFVTATPPPTFGGRVGMTVKQYKTAQQAYITAASSYAKAILAHSEAVVDCVGPTTIDDHTRSTAKKGAKITLECTP